MKLTSLSIKNFRAIRSLEINVTDFLSLIGPNNCGKSSILRAIEIFLNQQNPEEHEWHKSEEDQHIEIIGTFEDIQEWERDTPGVSGLVNENKIRLRLTARNEDGKIITSYDAFIRPVIIDGFAEKWGDLSNEVKEVAQSLGLDGTKWRSGANKERVKQKIIDEKNNLVSYGTPEWNAESISISSALKQAIPQAVIVPAVRNASDDSKPAAKTSFGLLLKRVVLPAVQDSEEYRNLLSAVDALSERMKDDNGEQFETVKALSDNLSERMSAIIDAKVVFKLETPDTDKFLGSSTGINLDDGIETPIHLQGHGAQRSLIFAMLEVLANQDATLGADRQRATILLFEEPEIYLHPHLMRRLRNTLLDIAKRKDWQVVITTHSPFFIDVADEPKSLVILNKPSSQIGVQGRQLMEDPFDDGDNGRYDREALRATLDFHPTVSEAFFAGRVVLVEGDTELSVLRHSGAIHLTMQIPQKKYDDTTVVSCGGKWTIPAMARVLRSFEVPFRVIHDCDRKGRTDAELETAISIDPFKANVKIQQASGDAAIYIVNVTI